jgi:hypothetical protein
MRNKKLKVTNKKRIFIGLLSIKKIVKNKTLSVEITINLYYIYSIIFREVPMKLFATNIQTLLIHAFFKIASADVLIEK